MTARFAREVALFAAALFPLAAAGADVPLELTHQGRLFDAAGAPVDADTAVTFGLYGALAGGSALWQQTLLVPVDDGYFSVRLGADLASPLDEALFTGNDALYLGMSVAGGAELSDRLQLVPVPYALRALSADALAAGGPIEVATLVVAGATVVAADGTVDWSRLRSAPPDPLAALGCGAGQVAVAGAGGSWACADEADHAHDAADVIDAFGITQIPVGTGSDRVAAGDHTHAFDAISGQISAGQLPVGDASGTVAAGDHGHASLGAVELAPGSTIGGAAIATGPHVPQVVVDYRYAQTTQARNLPTAMPWDDTVPQITEGNEVLAVTISPKSAGNLLIFEGTVNWVEPSNHSDYFTVALFETGVASAIASASDGASNGNGRCTAAGYPQMCTTMFQFTVVASKTTETTYRLRVGLNGGNVYFNQSTSGRLLGGSLVSTLSVTEIAQ